MEPRARSEDFVVPRVGPIRAAQLVAGFERELASDLGLAVHGRILARAAPRAKSQASVDERGSRSAANEKLVFAQVSHRAARKYAREGSGAGTVVPAPEPSRAYFPAPAVGLLVGSAYLRGR
jgi:hypothetical protein